MKKNTSRREKGITLIALVITTIILIILASISIAMILGNNGLLNKAKTAKEMYTNAQDYEETEIAKITNSIDSEMNGTRDINIEQLKNELKQELLQEISASANPTGTIIAYSANNVPTGYLKCEGQAVSRTEYNNLFNIIGTTYGNGDGSTTFNVPDLRGEFLRGTGTNSHTNQGNGETVGTHQDATQHFWEWRWGDKAWTPIAESQLQNFDSKINDVNRSYAGAFSEWYNSSTYPLYYTSRPTNTSVLYCIKY